MYLFTNNNESVTLARETCKDLFQQKTVQTEDLFMRKSLFLQKRFQMKNVVRAKELV